jgi:hypothetical protein
MNRSFCVGVCIGLMLISTARFCVGVTDPLDGNVQSSHFLTIFV